MQGSAPFLAQLGMAWPIIQAPMAGVATPQLAAAVSNAGGLGSLGLGASTAAQAQQMIEQTRALTSRPFNVNVFCHAPARRDAAREARWLAHLAPLFAQAGAAAPQGLSEIYRSFVEDQDMLQMLLAQRPAVVSFHFGLPPAGCIQTLRQVGIRLLATATSVQEAQAIEQAGLDGIVAQGIEAGGHRGMFDPQAPDEGLSTAVLLRQLVRRCRLPVVAAGGIMDAEGVQAALALGAAAVQMGTAFILCPESAANARYRADLQSPRAAQTRMTAVLSGRPARGIASAFMAYGQAPDAPPPPDYPVAYDATKQLLAALAHLPADGQGGCATLYEAARQAAPHWAGQGAPLAQALPAAELMAQLTQGLRPLA
ncbi:nitronate monooxygenase [Vandammella animalimorsus]|uniref:NAD(P)H-dependent flavin oxidoreductase n=1 Tax=Vandammella animalimorsus TaxID=2029117 RepID=UPI00325B1202